MNIEEIKKVYNEIDCHIREDDHEISFFEVSIAIDEMFSFIKQQQEQIENIKKGIDESYGASMKYVSFGVVDFHAGYFKAIEDVKEFIDGLTKEDRSV